MPTKQELENEINDRLGLDMQWSEMKKEDLEQFREGLEDQDFVLKFVGQYANDLAGDMTQEQVEGWEPGQLLQLAGAVQNGNANPMDFFM